VTLPPSPWESTSIPAALGCSPAPSLDVHLGAIKPLKTLWEKCEESIPVLTWPRAYVGPQSGIRRLSPLGLQPVDPGP